MKYYIRTTHDFNNKTREWEYRDLPKWKDVGTTTAIVHVIRRDYWDKEEDILKTDYEWSVEDFGLENIPKDVKEKQLKSLQRLVDLDMIRVKDL